MDAGVDGHQYIEIGYYFAHLMLRAQALKLLDDGRSTPIDGSPVSRSSATTDLSTYEAKKSHMSAISQLSTQILQRARLVEVAEIRVSLHPYLPRIPFLPLSSLMVCVFMLIGVSSTSLI
jgi:hypothetical protein